MGRKIIPLGDFTDDVRLLIVSDVSASNYDVILCHSNLADLRTTQIVLKNNRSKGERIKRIQNEIERRIFESDIPPDPESPNKTLLWKAWYAKEWNKMTELFRTRI